MANHTEKVVKEMHDFVLMCRIRRRRINLYTWKKIGKL